MQIERTQNQIIPCLAHCNFLTTLPPLPAPVPNSTLSLSEGFSFNANLTVSETSPGSLTVWGIKS